MSKVPILRPLCSLYATLASPSHSAVTCSECGWWRVPLSVSTHCELPHLGPWSMTTTSSLWCRMKRACSTLTTLRSNTDKHSLLLCMIHHLFCGSCLVRLAVSVILSTNIYFIIYTGKYNNHIHLITLYQLGCTVKYHFLLPNQYSTIFNGYGRYIVNKFWHFSHTNTEITRFFYFIQIPPCVQFLLWIWKFLLRLLQQTNLVPSHCKS